MKYRSSLLAVTFVTAFAAETNSGCSNRFIVKTGYSKLNNDNLRTNRIYRSILYSMKGNSDNLKKGYENHRMAGIGYAYKYYLPKDFFIGFNMGYENCGNGFHASFDTAKENKTAFWDFKLKHSVHVMPFIGVSIKNFDLFAMIGIEHTQVYYSQRVSNIQYNDPQTEQYFNDYKVHNWRGMYTWGAGIDMRINEKASLGIEYKKTRIKFSFIEYPRHEFRKKTHFKADHHTVSVAFKYRF